MNKLYAVAGIVMCIVIGAQSFEMYRVEHQSPCIDVLASGTVISVIKEPEFLSTVFFDQTNKMLKIDLASTSDKTADQRNKDKFKVGKIFKLCYVIE